MKKTRETKKRYFKYACFVLLFVLIVTVALLFLNSWEKRQGMYAMRGSDGNLNSAIIYNEKEYVIKENVETLLIMGLDKFEEKIDNSAYYNDQQADFLMLFVIDNDKKTCTAVHINRDTMTSMNILGVAGEKVGTITRQIALAHTYGNGKKVSCRNTADAVSEMLYSAKIDKYISLTMDSVSVMNELVDGVEVTVLDDFTGIDDTLIKGENVILRGEHALNYVRTRYGMEDSTNENRMVRQRQYLKALFEKTKQCAKENDEFILKAVVEMSEYMVSDCTDVQLQKLFEKVSTYEFTGIRSIEGKSVVGEKYMEFYPDGNKLEKLVVDLFYKPKD